MKAYGVNHFGHGYERSSRTFRKRQRRRVAALVDRKRQRHADRCLVTQLFKEITWN